MNAIPLNCGCSPPSAHLPNRAHQHEVQFYSGDDFLLEVVSRFIAQAGTGGDAPIVVATEPHWDGITQCLEARGVDVAEQIRNGRCVFADAVQLLLKITRNGRADGTEFANFMRSVFWKVRDKEADRVSEVAIFGELVAPFWAQGRVREAIEIEELWNKLAQAEPFYLLCAYPLAGFNRDTDIAPFLEVCNQHSRVVPSEAYLGLTNREDRLRSIACLQQKAQVLD